MTRAGDDLNSRDMPSPSRTSLSEEAARNTLALNPLIGLRGKDLMDGAATLLKAVVNEPTVGRRPMAVVSQRDRADRRGPIRSRSAAGDKRFADATWKNSGLHRQLLQAYLAWGDALNGFIDKTSLGDPDKARARFIANIFIDAASPTNMPLSNPAAVRQFFDTGGESLWRGFKNYLGDLAENGGLPAQVDKSRFKLGVNIATTPGAVVYRNELLEVIQYQPDTPEVRKRPVIITPPQINKFYSMDLSPDKSLVQYLLKSGIQVFCVSWRNPTAKERDWGLDTYVAALDEGTDAVREIAGSDDVTMVGACSGGITSAAYAGWLARQGEAKIKNIVTPVCVLDMASAGDSAIGPLVTPETLSAAKEASRLRGVLDGQDLARMFAWMRPNDLIWNYWVNNYLLGNQPPAFDILFWNADTTSLPARLHHDYVDMYIDEPLRQREQADAERRRHRYEPRQAGRLCRRRRHRPHHPVEGGVPHRQDLWRQDNVHPVEQRPSAEPDQSAHQSESVICRRDGQGAGRRRVC